MLEMKDVNTFYGESHILQGISLVVKTGECVALLGPNGMGKTTTLRTIMGLTPARKGTVKFDNQIIIHTDNAICVSTKELLSSDIFSSVMGRYLDELAKTRSPLLEALRLDATSDKDKVFLWRLIRFLADNTIEETAALLPAAERFLAREARRALHELIEGLYKDIRG